MENILYSKDEADALTFSERNEAWRNESEILKAQLIIDNIDSKKSLIDIGCGWGSTLIKLKDKIEIIVGVDESKDRSQNLINNYPDIDFYKAHSSKLPIESQSFDVVLMSHIFHEIYLFNKENDRDLSINESNRVLKENGYLIIIDHAQPLYGKNEVVFKIKNKEKLEEFIHKFKASKINFKIEDNYIKSDIWSVHEFVTKIWSLSTKAEELEMNETHLSLNLNDISKYISQFGFKEEKSCFFNPISNLMKYYGIELISENDWGRQLFLVMKKIKS